MKTAKPPTAAPETIPARRSQPVRQTRTNPPRTSTTASRNLGRDSVIGNARHEQPIDIFPGITHFSDTITALPKELVKHFTLLKEVDAKIHVPQQALFKLIDNALRLPTPNSTRSPYDGTPVVTEAPASAPMTAHNSTSGADLHVHRAHTLPAVPQASQGQLQNVDDVLGEPAFNRSNLPRRQLFRQVAFEIKEMLVALEEKNHVISTANDALNKQLARIDDIWPHLEQEFSEEAKWGSATHWAYPENRAAHRATNNAQAERSRREGAANLSAAAQQIAEEAAARSDARKQAVAARRSQKNNHHQDSDADSYNQKGDAKKASSSKTRKPLPEPNPAVGVGLGISGATVTPSANGTTSSSSRRRKVEKPASAQPMERALSGVFGATGVNGKTRTSSPRESPAPDGGAKKRKALPSGGNQAKKTRNGTSAASSPVIGAFPDMKFARGSPALATSILGSPLPESIGRFDDIVNTINGSLGISSTTMRPSTISDIGSSSAVVGSNKAIDGLKTATSIPEPDRNDGIKAAENVETGLGSEAGDNKVVAGASKTPIAAPNSGTTLKKVEEGEGALEQPASQSLPDALAPGRSLDLLQSIIGNGRQQSTPLALLVETQANNSGSIPAQAKEKQDVSIARSVADKAAMPGKEITAPPSVAVGGASIRGEPFKAEAIDSPPANAPPAKVDEPVAKKELTPNAISVPITQPQPVTTKSGRASKPSTPALGTFPETSRSRPSRTTENGGTGGNNSSTSSTSSNGAVKRSHKKGASISSQAHAHAALVANLVVEAAHGNGNGYHSSGSGTGTRQQQQQLKWYCDDCKKRLKVGERKTNGR
ncbi:phd finger domain containing protein [Grosmannia clavigera kw1407]|uniref:Phd finger domain containing protein n=1 Tax=Grosmannia clavigera (strain kw1407 / UAMH 11150) TaxID=655863 RepID=F0XD44_GROCL|nr:phd finger domain containing protein [Grosmannia clavigera kw1407]EFX03667.1 phd finger domain containing protein [Grosmannia clavigera kw1407]